MNEHRGAIAWMARNSVAANLLMVALILGGLFFIGKTKQEVFPQFELDIVIIRVAYPGASPAEVEQGVVLVVEEAVRAVEGVKEMRSTAAEGVGYVTVELLSGVDSQSTLANIKSAIDRIVTFPQDIERPIVQLASNRDQVISVIISGDKSERALRDLATMVRDDLLADNRITVAELGAVRPLEVSINITRDNLKRYDLTLEDVAQRIRQASIDLPSGGVRTSGGEILLRTTERRTFASEFGDIVLKARPDGSQIKVSDVSLVVDGFADSSETSATLNGKPAALVNVYRIGGETPVEIAEAVNAYIETQSDVLPPGVYLQPWGDRSELLEDRKSLLIRNAQLGLLLVLLSLGFFLNRKLAFWVTLGIPISFVGAFLMLPSLDVSINMISLFAFIVTLGIVVDDAIIIGEGIYTKRKEGLGPLEAAIVGAKELGTPVIFAIATNMIAFAPLLFVPGASGKFFRVIPLVVIVVLVLSLVESLFILPAHLAHLDEGKSKFRILNWIDERQVKVADGLEAFVKNRYQPFIRNVLAHKYLTLTSSVGLLILTMGVIAGGVIQFTFLPKIESDRISATFEFPYGSPLEQSEALVERFNSIAKDLVEEYSIAEGMDYPAGETISRGVLAVTGGQSGGFGSPRGERTASGSHMGQVTILLVPSGQREFTAKEFADKWRDRLGQVPGLESLKFRYSTGAGGGGDAISFRLIHSDIGILERAASELAMTLQGFDGVIDVYDGFANGKEQLDLKLKPEARALGLTEASMARQLRSSFYGAQAIRQQRGRDEVRVFVRLPKDERQSEYDIDNIYLRTPSGGEIPLTQAANVSRGRSFTSIRRVDGRRTMKISADVIAGKANANVVTGDLIRNTLPGLMDKYPGLSWKKGGQQRSQSETNESLAYGFLFALLGIYGLLAVVFKSYLQPVVIMSAIPFGIVGAIVGHLIMGFELSMISMLGIVALSGIVVNDSLILVVEIQKNITKGRSDFEAAVAAGMRRFRPILLTSLTTFVGLMPMILETSVQARFLVPMAISLGFGVLFATLITLVFIPASHLALKDMKDLIRGIFTLEPNASESPSS